MLLRILVRAGFSVTFAPMFLSHDGPYTQALNALRVRTLAAPQWTSLEAVVDAFAPRSDVLILSRAPVASKVFERIRRVAPATKILFDTVDLHFLRMEREAALSGNPADTEEARRMRDVELGLVRRADVTTVVSSYERRILRRLIPRARISLIPVMREIPLGAPAVIEHNRWQSLRLPRLLRRFKNPAADHVPAFETRRDIAFVGSYGHRPNVDGVLWFCREVWPLVLRRGFTGHFIVVGPEAPPEIEALASDTVEIRGHVADLGALFDACRLSVAPLRYGGGVKGKIVSSMSHGVPVVATKIAAEGMGLRSGRNILVADEPAAIADEIVRLYVDPVLWERLSRNAYAEFVDRFSEEAGAKVIVPLLDRLVARKRGTGTRPKLIR